MKKVIWFSVFNKSYYQGKAVRIKPGESVEDAEQRLLVKMLGRQYTTMVNYETKNLYIGRAVDNGMSVQDYGYFKYE